MVLRCLHWPSPASVDLHDIGEVLLFQAAEQCCDTVCQAVNFELNSSVGVVLSMSEA